MKKFLTILLALVFVPGCGRDPDPRFSTPEKTAQVIADAVKKDSYEDFYECVAQAERKKLNETMFGDFVDAWSGKFDVLESTKIMEGKSAVLRLRMYYNPGRGPGGIENKVIETRWVLEDGEWKVEFTTGEKLHPVKPVEEQETE